MDKMEKCRPDDSIIWATPSWQKTCSPRVLKEGERKAAGGGGGDCQKVLSLCWSPPHHREQTLKEPKLIKSEENMKLGEISHTMKSRSKSSQISDELSRLEQAGPKKDLDRDKCEVFNLGSKKAITRKSTREALICQQSPSTN